MIQKKDPFKELFEQVVSEIVQAWKKGIRQMSKLEEINFTVWFRIYQDSVNKFWIEGNFEKSKETIEQWKSLCLAVKKN